MQRIFFLSGFLFFHGFMPLFEIPFDCRRGSVHADLLSVKS